MYSTKYKKMSKKNFLKTLNLFSHPEFSAKNSLILFTHPAASHDPSNFGKTFPFSENSVWENKLRVSKNVLAEKSLCIGRISLQLQLQNQQKISKFYFNFDYGKLYGI